MRALIVDDERLARNELKRLLRAHPSIEVAGEAANADLARDLIDRLKPDLLFLDVQMPGQTGFELLEKLAPAPAVVFTTAYDHFAIRAFEVNALDYLLKPIEPERLAAAIEKVFARDAAADPDQRLTANDRVFVKDGDRCWFVTLAEVRLLESEGNYTRLFFGKEKPLIYRSLSYLADRLDPRSFFRVSRKHIVNLSWIEDLSQGIYGTMLVNLRDGGQVEMSRRQAQKFREILRL